MGAEGRLLTILGHVRSEQFVLKGGIQNYSTHEIFTTIRS